MSRVVFLKELKKFTGEAVRDLLLPVRQQREDAVPPPPRPAAVYGPRLPEMGAAAKKAPYILHQIVTGRDSQKPGEQPRAAVLVRTVFCVYYPDEEGGLALLNLMEQLRTALLERAVIGQRFCLDLEAGLETLVYPDDGEHPTTPYYLGEMVSSWRLPPVKRLDTARAARGMPPRDPSARHLEEIFGQKGSD